MPKYSLTLPSDVNKKLICGYGDLMKLNESLKLAHSQDLISLIGKLLIDTGLKSSNYTVGKYCLSEYHNSLEHTARFPILYYGYTNGKKYRFVISFAPVYTKIITL